MNSRAFLVILCALLLVLLAACDQTVTPPSLTQAAATLTAFNRNNTPTVNRTLPQPSNTPPLSTSTQTPEPTQKPTETTTPTTSFTPLPTNTPSPIPTITTDYQSWLDLCWVAYSPTQYDPNNAVYPNEFVLWANLDLLRMVGVNGLVTYAVDPDVGLMIPKIAQGSGFRGVIVGIWDPTSQEELDNAVRLARLPVVLGYVVGNEGLDVRYDFATLQKSIQWLKEQTGKPVTTSEEFGDYQNEELMQLGDWIFPNVHPYFAGLTEPSAAADWTAQVYLDFVRRAGSKTVIFKEVGLPSAGDPKGQLNENVQALYYKALNEKPLQFVYFEAFDQFWKQTEPIEPHWGFFTYEGEPKQAVQYLCPSKINTFDPGQENIFPVYTDVGNEHNHFFPTGYMGDTGDIQIDQIWTENPQSGITAIKITYTKQGKPPYTCDYDPPCNWAGMFWLNPADNWGTIPGAGYNLQGYTKLKFWARSNAFIYTRFGAGGVTGDYPDSLEKISQVFLITPEWKEYSINISGDLSHVIGGFFWSVSRLSGDTSPSIFYLDDIRYEK